MTVPSAPLIVRKLHSGLFWENGVVSPSIVYCRSLPADELAETVRKYNKRVQAAGSLSEAVNRGMSLAGEDDVVIAFGSLSFTGEITRLFMEWKKI